MFLAPLDFLFGWRSTLGSSQDVFKRELVFSEFKTWPREIRELTKRRPEYVSLFRALDTAQIRLSCEAKARCSEDLLRIIENIASFQEGLLSPWLVPLLEEGVLPIVTSSERREMETRGIDVYVQARRLIEIRDTFFIIDSKGDLRRLSEDVRKLWDQLLVDVHNLSRRRAFLVIARDRARSKRRLGHSIIKTFCIIAVALIVGRFFPALGKLIAVCGWSMFEEGRDLIALYRLGLPRAVFMRRLGVLILGCLLASVLVFVSEYFAIVHQSIFAMSLVILAFFVPFVVGWLAKVLLVRTRLKQLSYVGKLSDRQRNLLGLALTEAWNS